MKLLDRLKICTATGGLLLIVFAALSPVASSAKQPPQPPCDSPIQPAYPSDGVIPNVETWSSSDLPAGWVAPSCIGWASQHFTTLVAVAGVFSPAGGIDGLMSRFGAITSLRRLPYWSVTDKRLQPLVLDAHAVEGKSTNRPRPDFTPDTMRAGDDMFFLEHDNRSSSEVLYRMRIVETPDRLVVELDNVSRVSFMYLTVFAPFDLHSTIYLNRLEGGKWGYYSLSGTREGKLAALASHWQSYVNRAVALYAHTAQTIDMEGMPWAK